MNYENEMKLKNAMAYKKQINDLENATTENIEKLDNKIDVELKDVFENDTVLQAAIENVTENQENWQGDHYGEIEAWVRFDMTTYKELNIIDELDRYLENSETYVSIDHENDCLMHYIGQSIIINDNGDVYDQNENDKFFLNKNDYTINDETNEILRNKLIEKYMEETGCFPGIFQVDHYGNVSLVDTRLSVNTEKCDYCETQLNNVEKCPKCKANVEKHKGNENE